MRVIADHAHLLAEPEETAAPRRVPERPWILRTSAKDGPAPIVPKKFGALLATIAVVLIALHAICAAMILDRALAHAPGPVTMSQGD